MENPCKILFFGDSITKKYAPLIESILKEDYPEIELTVINAGVIGETSRDGLARMKPLLDEKPNVVVVGFGMNDWRKGVDRCQYKKNLVKILESFEAIHSRVIMTTVSPSYNFKKRKYNTEVDAYSEVVREIAYEKRIKIADINAHWKQTIKPVRKGLHDELHPNKRGIEVVCQALMWVIPRRNTTVLWQYNSREAKCNFRCPYCYYIGLHHPSDLSFGRIEEWHESFKKSFGNQHLIVYLGFGEPSLGKMFPEIVDLFGSEANWELRLISNISTKELKATVKTKLAREGRLHIVSSFHPCQTSREEHLERLLFFRDHGMEVPIVYVGYPPYLKRFEDDIEFFRKSGFVVHVRRMQGYYRKKLYPYAYTEDERVLIARYQDNGMLKIMQSGLSSHGELTYAGLHFFVMDNVGNLGYDSNAFWPYTMHRCIFGNLHQRNFKPLLLPGPYPGYAEGTADGVANLVKLNYKELEGNHVLAFARQGGVYKTDSGDIHYANEHIDFSDPKSRADYFFPPRGLRDIFAYQGTWKLKMLYSYIEERNQSLFMGLGRFFLPRPWRSKVRSILSGKP